MIENPVDISSHIIFPDAVTGKDIAIKITGSASQTIYFENMAVTKGAQSPTKSILTSEPQAEGILVIDGETVYPAL